MDGEYNDIPLDIDLVEAGMWTAGGPCISRPSEVVLAMQNMYENVLDSKWTSNKCNTVIL